MLAAMISNETPTAEASADADPPAGVGDVEANAASNSRSDWSASMSVRETQRLLKLLAGDSRDGYTLVA